MIDLISKGFCQQCSGVNTAFTAIGTRAAHKHISFDLYIADCGEYQV